MKCSDADVQGFRCTEGRGVFVVQLDAQGNPSTVEAGKHDAHNLVKKDVRFQAASVNNETKFVKRCKTKKTTKTGSGTCGVGSLCRGGRGTWDTTGGRRARARRGVRREEDDTQPRSLISRWTREGWNTRKRTFHSAVAADTASEQKNREEEHCRKTIEEERQVPEMHLDSQWNRSLAIFVLAIDDLAWM